ncbi:MAG TPA: hypothetical protein PKZ15_06390 [Paludibacteraceae bacterium]|nr:hypothetical protein [Paludibacteraceae bacterium]
MKSSTPDWRATKRYLVFGCVCGDFACWKQATPVGERPVCITFNRRCSVATNPYRLGISYRRDVQLNKDKI